MSAFKNRDAEQLWEQLKRIADSLELIASSVEPVPQVTEPDQTQTNGCPHPEEHLMSLGTTPDGTPEVECTLCRTRISP